VGHPPMTGRAVCIRCGADKLSYDRICPSCGQRPEGEGLLVAWLLSDAHLNAEQLDRAASRVRRGEAIRPSDKMLALARLKLGTHQPDLGLPPLQRRALLATSLLLTPLVGFTLWFWWRESRQRAATEALWLSLPASALTLLWVGWRAGVEYNLIGGG
jgi:hypothetical protein